MPVPRARWIDGLDAEGTCSTVELAKRLAAPVVLVVNVAKTTRTVAAMVLGCRALDPEVPLAGVILNRVATSRQERLIREYGYDEHGAKEALNYVTTLLSQE